MDKKLAEAIKNHPGFLVFKGASIKKSDSKTKNKEQGGEKGKD